MPFLLVNRSRLLTNHSIKEAILYQCKRRIDIYYWKMVFDNQTTTMRGFSRRKAVLGLAALIAEGIVIVVIVYLILTTIIG